MSITYGSLDETHWFSLELDDDDETGGGSMQSMSKRWRLNEIVCLFPPLHKNEC